MNLFEPRPATGYTELKPNPYQEKKCWYGLKLKTWKGKDNSVMACGIEARLYEVKRTEWKDNKTEGPTYRSWFCPVHKELMERQGFTLTLVP